jgi:DNA-binding response OmpR family regulator
MEGLKLLLVDDEEEFAATLAERLELRGFEVVTANDGEEALRLVQIDPPEVLVLDVRMPGLGGMDVLRKMRADHAHIPVILLTGLGSTAEGIEGMRLGAFDFLMKPVQIEALIEKIRDAARRSDDRMAKGRME